MRADPSIRLPFLDEPDAGRGWESDPAAPRDAASVILLRDGSARQPGAVEVHLLLRHSRMPFAPRAVVFPGGGVDQRDADVIDAWAGPDPDAWAELLGVDADTARGVLGAAARETFEETGVLLATDVDGAVVDSAPESWETERRRLVARELSWAQLLRDHGLTFRSDWLKPWSRWTTPAFEPRRYRTWFFAARVPDGQQTRDVSGETDSVEWSSVRDALVRAERDELLMFPPQICLCLELFDFVSADQAMSSDRDVEQIMPTVAVDARGSYLELPSHLVALARSLAPEFTTPT